jgi:hypothetical protein
LFHIISALWLFPAWILPSKENICIKGSLYRESLWNLTLFLSQGTHGKDRSIFGYEHLHRNSSSFSQILPTPVWPWVVQISHVSIVELIFHQGLQGKEKNSILPFWTSPLTLRGNFWTSVKCVYIFGSFYSKRKIGGSIVSKELAMFFLISLNVYLKIPSTLFLSPVLQGYADCPSLFSLLPSFHGLFRAKTRNSLQVLTKPLFKQLHHWKFCQW